VTISGLEQAGRLFLPHGWFDQRIARKGNYLYQANGETSRKLSVFDISQPAKPKLLRFVDHGSDRLFMNHLAGDLLICCDQAQYLVPFDISDPERPRELPVWHPYYPFPTNVDQRAHCVLRGNQLFLTCGSMPKPGIAPTCELRVYALAKPFKPSLKATLTVFPHFSSAIQGHFTKGRRWPWPGGVVEDGNLLHVLWGGQAVTGIDVSTPFQPRVVYVYEPGTEWVIRGLVRKDKTLFLSLNSTKWRVSRQYRKSTFEPGRGVVALDVTDAAHPREIGVWQGLPCVTQMLAAGDRLYVTGATRTDREDRMCLGLENRNLQVNHWLHILDVSDPASMKSMGRWKFPMTTGSRGFGMVENGEHLYVGDSNAGLLTLHVVDPRSIREVDRFTNTSEIGQSVLAGDHAYVVSDAGSVHNLNVVDVKDPQQPKLLRSIAVPYELQRHFRSLTIEGPGAPRRFLYLMGRRYTSEYRNLLTVLDLADPARPEPVRIVELPEGCSFPWAPTFYDLGEHVLIVVRGQRRVDKKREREAALLIYRKTEEGANMQVETVFGLPGLSGAGGPAQPVWTDGKVCHVVTLEPSESSPQITFRGFGVTMKKHMPTVTLTTLDIADLAKPKVLASVALHQGKVYRPGAYLRIIRKGDRLYLLGEAGIHDRDGPPPQLLYVYSVKDPAKPVLLSSLENRSAIGHMGSLWDMSLLEPYPTLAIQIYNRGLTLVDVSNPRRPQVLWEEPVVRGPADDHEQSEATYNRVGYDAGVLRDGRLFVARMDHYDVFKVRTVPAASVTREARAERIQATLRASSGFRGRNGGDRSAALIRRRLAQHYWSQGQLAQAESWCRALEEVTTNGLPQREPDAVAMQSRTPIRIDGKADEWDKAPAYGLGDGKAKYQIQWDSDGLYFLFRVTDATYLPAPEDKGIWEGDDVELFLNTSQVHGPRAFSPGDYHYLFSPTGRCYIHSTNPRFVGQAAPRFTEAAGKRTGDGYVLEVKISPLETWFVPQIGARIAWKCWVQDKYSGVVPLREELREYAIVDGVWPVIELR